ncbi:MAG: hypothetical protein ACLGJD_27560 [Gammaproteobacteria bacterium]|jgi:hypothetical protein
MKAAHPALDTDSYMKNVLTVNIPAVLQLSSAARQHVIVLLRFKRFVYSDPERQKLSNQ